MPTTEIVTFTVSEAYKTDQSIINLALDVVKKADGYIDCWTGFQTEDPNVAYVIIIWESYEHHKALINSPSYGVDVMEPLKLCVAGSIEVIHVPFAPDAVPALSAPTTELAFITHKDEATDTLHGLLEKLAEHLDKAPGSRPHCSYGPVREKPGVTALLVGWDSAEAHWQAVAPDTPLYPIIGSIKERSDISLKHTDLTKKS